jgi:predicted dehydrogenase
MVGLQAWESPFVSKIKEIVESGQIGKVLSTTFLGNPGFFGLREPEFIAYTQGWKTGGNMVAIYIVRSAQHF